LTPESKSEQPADLRGAVEAATEQLRKAQETPPPQQEPRTPFLTRPPVVGVVTLAFLAVVAWNIVRLRTEPPLPTAEEGARAVPAAMYVAAQTIETFRDEHGRLPATLEEAGLPPGEFQYSVDGDQYHLAMEGGGQTEEFQSQDGMEALLEALAFPDGVPGMEGGTR